MTTHQSYDNAVGGIASNGGNAIDARRAIFDKQGVGMSLNGLEIMSRVSELKAEQEQLRQSIHALKGNLELNASNLTFLEKDLKHYAAIEQEDSTGLLENESESASSKANPLSQQLINWSKGINYEIGF